MAREKATRKTAPAAKIPSIEKKQVRQLCEAFGKALDARDGRRAGHAADAAFYAGLIAQEMKLSSAEVEQVEIAALLHGIGKITVEDDLLQKTSPLSASELEEVRHASVEGAHWLQGIEGMELVPELVRHQGEHWDGSGYPDGLVGDAIPAGARVLGVALRFAAMIRPRADRPAMSVVGGALEFLAYDAGLALDPTAVRAFLTAMGREFSDEENETEQPMQNDE